MENYKVIKGCNIKTSLPIVYAAPIYADSEFSQLNVPCRDRPPEIVNIDTGFTHMTNDGLWPGGDQMTRQDFLIKYNNRVGLDTVYDPRFTGYCDDTWRAYEDELGRIQWDYSDIDSIKIPQYIERNQLDNAIDMAEQHFTNMQMVQREMMQRDFIDKYASDRLQRSLFPVHTLGQKLT